MFAFQNLQCGVELKILTGNKTSLIVSSTALVKEHN